MLTWHDRFLFKNFWSFSSFCSPPFLIFPPAHFLLRSAVQTCAFQAVNSGKMAASGVVSLCKSCIVRTWIRTTDFILFYANVFFVSHTKKYSTANTFLDNKEVCWLIKKEKAVGISLTNSMLWTWKLWPTQFPTAVWVWKAEVVSGKMLNDSFAPRCFRAWANFSLKKLKV